MARIAFAWELGGSIGHAVACARLGDALLFRGHTVALMMRDLASLRFVPEAAAFEVFQAPRWRMEVARQPLVTYADILRGCGYHDSVALTGLLGGWRTLLSGWAPDLVVADFAPTALLAARSLGLKRATYGNGFFTPPRLDPLPPFRLDSGLSPEALAQAEADVLHAANAALERFGQAPLECLARQFEADADFLCTFPELDHYGSRPQSHYWGPRMSVDSGANVHWPAGTGKRVMVYVQPGIAEMDELIESLRVRDACVVAFIPNLSARHRDALAGPRRRVASGPVRLDHLLPDCDLVVCHGGDIGTGALVHGVPVLVFPQHYEQYLTGRRIAQAGAGAMPSMPRVAGEIGALLDRLLAPEPKQAARAFRQRYPDFSPREQRRRILAGIEHVLAR